MNSASAADSRLLSRAVVEEKPDSEAKSVVDARWSLWASGFSLAAAVVVTLVLLLSFCLRTWHAESLRAGIDGMPLLLKPISDSRTYHYSQFDNGLEVVNIYDPEAVSAAYSMAVQAGSWDDPHAIPGLAHFCEHMLFLGSQNFPSASGYDNFVNSHGGYLNAFTAEQATVYFTELSSSGFDEGLARFADMLQAPRFDSQYTEKEVHAISSEHAKNQQDPSWRLDALMHSLANPRSPVSRFHTGDVETLQQGRSAKSLQRALKTWYKAHYCPSRMHLVTLSSQPVNEQLDKAKALFGNMSAGSQVCQTPAETWENPEPWSRTHLGKFVTVLGTQPQPLLVLYFPLPDLTKEFASQPTAYLHYVLTYGGERSMVTLLRDGLGLISTFDIGVEMSSAGGALIAEFSLSEKGLQMYGHVLDVLFQYLSTLRSNPVDRDLYSSISNMTRLNWDWSSRSTPADTVSGLAERMTRLPPQSLLSGDTLIRVPDPALVADLLTLLGPENMNAFLVDPAAEERFGNRPVETLDHYGVKHTIESLWAQFPEGHLLWERWLTPSGAATSEAELNLRLKASGLEGLLAEKDPDPPEPIDNIPKAVGTEHMKAEKPEISGDFVASLFGSQPVPLSLQGSGGGGNLKLSGKASNGTAVSFLANATGKKNASYAAVQNTSTWYREGWVTTSPKVKFSVSLRPWRTEEQWESPASDSVRLQLYSSLLGQHMAPQLFDDGVIGSNYDLRFSSGGVSLGFGGFPELLPGLVDRVMKGTLKSVKRSSGIFWQTPLFERVKREMTESLRSYSEMPVQYAIEDRSLLLTTGTHSKEETLSALEKADFEGVAQAPEQLLLRQPLELTALVMGNVAKDDGRGLLASAVAGLKKISNISTVGNGEGEVLLVTPVVNPGRPVELRKRNPRAEDPNGVAVVTLLAGVSTVERRVIYALLGQMLSQLAYDELRTEKQLGYVVSAGDLQISNIQAVSVVVQGNVLDADSMEAAIEKVYFDSMPKRLHKLTDEEFGSYKAALKHQLLEPPLDTSEEFSHWWGLVSMHGACLGLRNSMLQYLEKSVDSKQLLVDAWSKLIIPGDGAARQKVAVKYFAGTVPPRASQEAALELWKEYGVTGRALKQLALERDLAAVESSADSAARQRLARHGGYFPRELRCTLEEDGKKAQLEKEDSKKKASQLLEQAPLVFTQRRLRRSQEVLAPK